MVAKHDVDPTPVSHAIADRIIALRDVKWGMLRIAKELRIGTGTVHRVVREQAGA